MASTLGGTVTPAADGVVSEHISTTSQVSPTSHAEMHQGLATNENIPFLLSRDWIYRSTAVWSSTQERGTIISYIPIHPTTCNWPNNHIYEMFNAQVGGMSIRVQPMSTFQYGGSLKIGWLPPTLKPEDFPSVSLELLSTFPTINIDPKDTNYTCFTGEDQRRIHFHTGPLDFGNQDSFGGYIVLFVMGKLVTSGEATSNTISLVIESAGKFEYMQPNPHFIKSMQGDDHPLSTLGGQNAFLEAITCDSRIGSQNTTLMIQNSTTRNTNVGWWGARGVDGRKTMDFPQVTGLSAIKREVGEGLLTGSTQFKYSGNLDGVRIGTAPGTTTWRIKPEQRSTGPTLTFPQNINVETIKFSVRSDLLSPKDTFAYTLTNSPSFLPQWTGALGNGKWTIFDQIAQMQLALQTTVLDPDPVFKGCYTYSEYEDGALPQIRNMTGPIATQGGTLNQRRSGESFVFFLDRTSGAVDMQTVEIGRAMSRYKTTDLNITWVYNVNQYDDADDSFLGTVLVLRLWPEGYFTTSGVTSTFALPSIGFHYRLEFNETLPANSPLPRPPSTLINIMRACSKGLAARADQLF